MYQIKVNFTRSDTKVFEAASFRIDHIALLLYDTEGVQGQIISLYNVNYITITKLKTDEKVS